MSISHLVSAAVLVLMSTAAAAPLPVRSISSDQERVVADTCVVLTVTVDGKAVIVRVCQPDTPPLPPM